MPVGRGLFANCSAGTAEITGQAPDSATVAVEAGWNVIGPPADSVDTASITSTPPGIVTTNFFRFSLGGGYTGASTLGPGRGYWVKVSESGTLDLSGSGDGAAALAAPLSASQSPTTTAVELRVTDAAGRTATLRLAEDLTDTQRQRHALPPTPPGETFDVRFENGRTAAEAGSDDLRAIETQGLTTPVTATLVGAEDGTRVRLRHGGETTRLTTERSSATLTSTKDLAVGLQAAPEAFALEKAYPNPVSERATVAYALPEPADVTIAVYDLLGRRVATLTDGTQPAGQHQTTLDAGQMPSGTYFVRMRAEGFRQTRQVTVVR